MSNKGLAINLVAGLLLGLPGAALAKAKPNPLGIGSITDPATRRTVYAGLR
jgi:hypothetical protein